MDWDHFRWLVRRRPVLRVSLGYFDGGEGVLGSILARARLLILCLGCPFCCVGVEVCWLVLHTWWTVQISCVESAHTKFRGGQARISTIASEKCRNLFHPHHVDNDN